MKEINLSKDMKDKMVTVLCEMGGGLAIRGKFKSLLQLDSNTEKHVLKIIPKGCRKEMKLTINGSFSIFEGEHSFYFASLSQWDYLIKKEEKKDFKVFDFQTFFGVVYENYAIVQQDLSSGKFEIAKCAFHEFGFETVEEAKEHIDTKILKKVF